MKTPWFAVIGTGRCGTGYLATLLRRATSLQCGHEQWFGINGPTRRDLDGDSSWLAVPGIESGLWSGKVVHLVRTPSGVADSFDALGFFDRGWEHGIGRHAPYQLFVAEHCPELRGLEGRMAAIAWWFAWNERCSRLAGLRVRLGDLPGRLPQIGEFLGVPVDMGEARKVGVINARRG